MKSFGAILDFTHERNDDLMRVFRYHMQTQRRLFLPHIFSLVAESPAERFWVSDARAKTVIAAMLAGKKLPKMRENKKEMFIEILRRYNIMRRQRPHEPFHVLIGDVIRQPAPKFYLTPRTVGELINKIRSGFYD